MQKRVLMIVAAIMTISSLSYAIFDRPAESGRARGFDIDYTDPQTGQTRRRFAPIEAVFGGHDYTKDNGTYTINYPNGNRTEMDYNNKPERYHSPYENRTEMDYNNEDVD